MKNHVSAAAAVLALILALPCAAQPAGQPPSQRSSDARNGNPEGEGLSKATPARIGKADRAFVTKAAASGMFEVEASRLAASRAASADVKALAATILEDHLQAHKGLQQISLAHNYPLPETLSDAQSAQVKRLSSLSGAAFDSAYRREVGIQAHEDAIKAFKSASRATRTPDLKRWVDQSLPKLMEHLEAARRLPAPSR
jgi:putative membrane protein